MHELVALVPHTYGGNFPVNFEGQDPGAAYAHAGDTGRYGVGTPFY